MSYQQPAFMVDHPVVDVGIAGISSSQGTGLTDDDERALIDFRVGDFCSFSTTSTGHGIDVDFGANQTLNRVVIPAGHNLDGESIEVYTDDNSGFTSATLRGSISSFSGSGVADVDLDTNTGTNERYWRTTFPSGVAVSPEFSELWMGTYTQLSSSAWVDQAFGNGYQSQITRVDYPGGRATLQLAPARRRFSLRVRNLDPAGADYSLLESVIAVGVSRPFWYWGPDTVDDGPFLVQLEEDGGRIQEFQVPSSAIRYDVQLRMVESDL